MDDTELTFEIKRAWSRKVDEPRFFVLLNGVSKETAQATLALMMTTGGHHTISEQTWAEIDEQVEEIDGKTGIRMPDGYDATKTKESGDQFITNYGQMRDRVAIVLNDRRSKRGKFQSKPIL